MLGVLKRSPLVDRLETCVLRDVALPSQWLACLLRRLFVSIEVLVQRVRTRLHLLDVVARVLAS